MKKLLLVTLFLPASLWAFQKNTAAKPVQAPSKGGSTVTLTCRLYGTTSSAETVYLYENLGLAKRVVSQANKSGADSAYVLIVPAGPARFYSVGANEQSTAKIILGAENSVTLWGNTQFMHKARTINSPANKALESFQERLTQFATEGTQVRAQLNQSTGTMRRTVEERVAQLASAK